MMGPGFAVAVAARMVWPFIAFILIVAGFGAVLGWAAARLWGLS